ncbi:DUF309 domain-containing protein [Naumannella sp. ID2617S]|uniref:DUF309 domain-containing protein n=1 Tax=Enemella dayhoffiae TaxID=2016507 RepID=A0A255H461_9ACTN|nr:DUF309 domain-containing protein [Enemella dayhoffiae]NNG19424.1 DUF309 domain-containing protein [Naumannella sp. ID2617S]OYO22066.1 hypothetical protein CGZ93_09135 [Enemella dayhoffiae]
MSRDRDPEGRARSARPRDGLGRPLAHDAVGVPRLGEGVTRTPQQTLTEAVELLRAGRPFHAHEVFEDAWKSCPDEERAFWRALAQLAVGLTHAARGNAPGAAGLLRRGATALRGWRDTTHGADLQVLLPQAERWAAAADASDLGWVDAGLRSTAEALARGLDD